MVILVTGAKGFIGRNIVNVLEANKFEVLFLDCDLTKYDAVASYFSNANFKNIDVVLHLAGVSSVAECEHSPVKAFRVNFEATYNLADIVQKKFPRAHFVFFSTGQVYSANVDFSSKGLTEESYVAPNNIYSLSKKFAEDALQVISFNKKLTVTVLRLFNHTHHSQNEKFFLPSIYHQIKRAKAVGLTEVDLTVGNIDLYRDIGAIIDLLDLVVKVIRHPVKHGNFDVFNVSTGRSKHLRILIESLAKELKIDVRYLTDENRLRPNEPVNIIGNSQKAQIRFSWAPKNGMDEASLVRSFLRDLN